MVSHRWFPDAPRPLCRPVDLLLPSTCGNHYIPRSHDRSENTNVERFLDTPIEQIRALAILGGYGIYTYSQCRDKSRYVH